MNDVLIEQTPIRNASGNSVASFQVNRISDGWAYHLPARVFSNASRGGWLVLAAGPTSVVFMPCWMAFLMVPGIMEIMNNDIVGRPMPRTTSHLAVDYSRDTTGTGSITIDAPQLGLLRILPGVLLSSIRVTIAAARFFVRTTKWVGDELELKIFSRFGSSDFG